MDYVYLGLGSNVNPRYHLRSGLRALERKFGRLRISPVYRNPAVGFEGDDFLNLAVRVRCNLKPLAMKEWLHALEDDHGRERGTARFSNRTLDVDVLMYGDRVIEEDGLTLPRPDILEYAHVLKPLADLAPKLVHPREKRSMAALWAEFDASGQPLTPTTI